MGRLIYRKDQGAVPQWQPGQSGNPKGRPPKARAMTALLERAGAKTVEMPDGKRIAGRRFVASAMWEMATTGQVTMLDGQVWKVTPAEWFDAVKWIYAQVDGAPKQSIELDGGFTLAIAEEIVDASTNTDDPTA